MNTNGMPNTYNLIIMTEMVGLSERTYDIIYLTAVFPVQEDNAPS